MNCKTHGDLADRLVAALLVVSGQSTGKPWVDRKSDLWVENHLQAVDELKRLVRLQRAYLHMNAGDLVMEKLPENKGLNIIKGIYFH